MRPISVVYSLGLLIAACFACASTVILSTPKVAAVTEAGNVSVTAVVPGDPPTSTAVIVSPQNNTTVTVTPLVVKGTCEQGLKVAVYNLDALAGTGECDGDGSFTINIGLLVGKNILTTKVFDDFDRFGPLGDEVVVFVEIPEETEQPTTETPIENSGTTPWESSAETSTGGQVESFVANNIVTPILQTLHINSGGPVPRQAQIFYAGAFAVTVATAADILLFDALVMKASGTKLRTAGRGIRRIARRKK